MNARTAALFVALAASACRRPRPVVDDDAGEAVARGDANVGPRPWCRAPREVALRGGDVDASATAGARSVTLAFDAEGAWTAGVVDGASGELSLRGASGREERFAIGPGETSDPSVAVGARGVFVGWARESMGGREHVARFGAAPNQRCTTPELRDEGLTLSVAATPRGAVLVWDEDGPAPSAGSVKAQLVDPSAPTPCGAPRQVSPPEQDASDPISVALPDGVAVFWLTARDVAASESNDTATDVWGLALDAGGAPRGRAVRITAGPGHRFGLAAWADAGAVWLAYRDAGPSDNESRGDGGEVVAVRLAHGPRGLSTPTPPARVTADVSNPTGAPRVTAALTSGAAAEVWWAERHGPRVSTWHRPLRPTGGVDPDGAPVEEPVMEGALPFTARPGGVVVFVSRRGARAAVATTRCAP